MPKRVAYNHHTKGTYHMVKLVTPTGRQSGSETFILSPPPPPLDHFTYFDRNLGGQGFRLADREQLLIRQHRGVAPLPVMVPPNMHTELNSIQLIQYI